MALAEFFQPVGPLAASQVVGDSVFRVADTRVSSFIPTTDLDDQISFSILERCDLV